MQITSTGAAWGYLSGCNALDHCGLLSQIRKPKQARCSEHTVCADLLARSGGLGGIGTGEHPRRMDRVSGVAVVMPAPGLTASASSRPPPPHAHPSRRKLSPTNAASSPHRVSAKPTEAMALFHWHSFVCIRGFARIISLTRRGRLLLCASTQQMYAGKIIQSHFTACLVPKKELTPSNSMRGRVGSENWSAHISSEKCYIKLLRSYIESVIFVTIGTRWKQKSLPFKLFFLLALF